MSSNRFHRGRRPVISIHTQPEEESTLRAEIKAASRTQHEILPRYSWHPTFMRRENTQDLKRTYPPILHKASRFSHSSVSDATETSSQYGEPVSMPRIAIKKSLAILTRASDTDEPRKRFTQSPNTSDALGSRSPDSNSTRTLKRQAKRRKEAAQIQRWNNDVVTDQDRATQEAQWSAWLEEIIEERNTVPDLQQIAPPKPKRTLRKSVYGSLSSTKSFFRSPSKSSLARLYNRAGVSLPSTPHVYGFEDKDQLRRYLNSETLVSPVSPTEQKFQVLEVPQEITEPVELSAGPVAAELEDSSLNAPTQLPPLMSRTSTPSIRDSPPSYVEEKKFQADMAKDQDNHSFRSRNVADNELSRELEIEYVCNACQNEITRYKVYNFCTGDDLGNCVLCTRCADQDLRCRHQPKRPAGNAPTRQAKFPTTQIRRKAIGSGPGHELRPCDMATTQGNKQSLDIGTELESDLLSSSSTKPTSFKQTTGDNILEMLRESKNEIRNVQLELLKEMDYLRREQDIVHRERELSLRARELEMRDHTTSLREREAIFQQKNDTLMRNLETLVSYQELAKGAFIGAQFQAQYASNLDLNCPKELFMSKDDPALSDLSSQRCDNLQHRSRPSIAKVVAAAEASIQNISEDESHVKSCQATKRKKGGPSGSNSSSPAAPSSPEQSRKPPSRKDSGRGGSPDEEEDEENRRYPKKHKQEPLTPNDHQKLFACPYAKNNPVRYSSRNMYERHYRGCGTHYLPDVSRLKQHLRRVHWQPETYCPRCYQEFENSAGLIEHASAAEACTNKPCPFPEKMDKTQQEKIHFKRPRVQPKTVWYDIYKVLFPGQPLPESPYMEGDDRVITPLSAVPQSTIDVQAIRTFSDSFNRQLDQHEELQQSPLRPKIQQAFDESFKEFLRAFTVSPNASPGAPPSIVVSPVSRSSSDVTRQLDSPLAFAAKAPRLERQRSITSVPSQPQRVPLLQQPRPRPKVNTANTALQVPTDHHRSPSRQSRGSQGAESPLDNFFSTGLLPHVTEDQGWGEDCYSFKVGDDLSATAAPGRPALESSRNKSVDSGYGSGRSRNHPNTLSSTFNTASAVSLQGIGNHATMPDGNLGNSYQGQTEPAQPTAGTTLEDINYALTDQAEHGVDDFADPYYNLLGFSAQTDLFSEMDPSLLNPYEPWV